MNKHTASSPAPRISIVMAAFNEEREISKALDSIISQTFPEWELIVVDDGSTDATADIVRKYAAQDSRIKLYCNSANMQLPASLNKAVGLAGADLIARADADDVNLPDRLAKQYQFMQHNQDIDVLGTGAFLMDADGNRTNAFFHPATHAELERLSFLKVHFFHPSVMIRRRFFDVVGLYDANYPLAEDKEIWLRGLRAGCRYANLPEPLIEYGTDNYVKSWSSIRRHGASLFRIARNMEIKRGYFFALALFAYTAAIKLRLYKPSSIRRR